MKKELANYLLNISALTYAGMFLTAVMATNISHTRLIVFGLTSVIITALAAFAIIYFADKNNHKN
ncbi:MAG: hypothetical protein LBU92_05205 [Prevotellaceae bacterium]|jgi:hypothetical protein|nr:hypothetical protein [Prevotellaceae bacterium]